MGDRSRDLLLQNNEMVYEQNQKINEMIGILEQTSETAIVVQTNISKQGQKLNEISNNNKDIQQETRRADKTMNAINRREFYYRAMLYAIALLLFISIIAMLVLKFK